MPLARETFLFTDSKGSDIKDILPTLVENKFHVIYKSGETVYDKKNILVHSSEEYEKSKSQWF